MRHLYLTKNTAGRDWLVGDLHGWIGATLREELSSRGFDFERDRLIAVGDLVDRGPASDALLDLLDQPWFYSIMGNHEMMLMAYHEGHVEVGMYAAHGGAWAIGMMPIERLGYVDAVRDLPLCITLETSAGLLGVVHSAAPRRTWAEVVAEAEGRLSDEFMASLMWKRGPWGHVAGVRAVVCGHTTVSSPDVVGNHVRIDTGGWNRRRPGGHFTFLDAETLQPVLPVPLVIEGP